jgi:hypothetical protein
MRIGGSLALIAIGAILRFALTRHYWQDVNIWAVGVILMVVGLLGLVLTAIYDLARRRTDIYRHGPDGTTGTSYISNDPAAPRY